MASPDFVVKCEIGKTSQGKTLYLTVGKGWGNKAGGVNLILDAVPIAVLDPKTGVGKIKLTAWPYEPNRERQGGGYNQGNHDSGDGDTDPPF